MKHFLIIAIFILLSSFANSQQRWEVIISSDSTNFEFLNTSYSYDQGSYVISRTTTSSMLNNILFKRDINGEPLWNKNIQFSEFQAPYGVLSHDNITFLFGIQNNGANLIALNECGELIWCNNLINEEYYQAVYVDAVITDDNKIILLLFSDDQEYVNDVGLVCFDFDGNMLWFKPFLLEENHEMIASSSPFKLDVVNNSIIISGFIYKAYPDNPSLVWLKPMIIKTDSQYNEEWLLPFGMNDSIIGFAHGSIQYNGSGIQSYGWRYKPNTDTIVSLLMNINQFGDEDGFHIIENNVFGPDNVENTIMQVFKEDVNYFAMGRFGMDIWCLPFGEWLMDSVGNVFEYQSHLNTSFGIKTLHNTINDKYLTAYRYNLHEDIILYKFNSDLSNAPTDTNSYNYDYLCDNLPIESDIVYIEGCSIITDVGEIPTPEQYYSQLQTIPINVFPNPVSDDITIELGSNEHHSKIVLKIIDINGKTMFEKKVLQGETQMQTSVSNLQSGMYIVTVLSDEGASGSKKFVVKNN